MPFTRPPFIYRGGGMMLHSPFRQDDSLMFGFFVRGDREKLQTVCDQYLNSVARGKYIFRPMTDYLMLTFTRINRDYSLYPEDRVKGWGKEIDTSVWMPVGRFIRDDNGDEQLDYIHWFTPYIWVDHPMTVLNGREIFGYPKYMAQFQMPDNPDNADYFRVEVNGFQPYGPDTEAIYRPLIEVKKTADKPPFGERITTMADLGRQVFAAMASRDDFDLPSWNMADEFVEGLLSPYLPQLFLKQFPDGAGDRAVYQALTESPAVVEKIHGAGFLSGDYELTMHPFDQVPMADELGLKIGAQDTALAFWLHFDFTIQPATELVNNSQAEPEKIAILGGGVSSMTAAFALTSEPGWQSKYDITLYQMGWRVGGKGASGRNAKLGQRIEEHGLHIWFGFYQNAFKVMQDAYGELDRPANAPLARWDDAFKRQSFIALQEYIDNEWKTWPIEFPENNETPGNSRESLDIWMIAEKFLEWLLMLFGKAFRQFFKKPSYDGIGLLEIFFKGGWAALKFFFKRRVRRFFFHKHSKQHSAEQMEKELGPIEALHNDLVNAFDKVLDVDDEIRRLFVILDFGLTSLRGMIADGVFRHGYDVINDLDFRDWLRKHGASEKYTVNSSLVRGLYDLVFAYVDGDIEQPNIEAGTCLRGALRIAFAYEGAVMWEMQAGMGDVVFTPLYQVLRRRGVKFEFFNKVEELQADSSGQSVDKIRITEQVAMKEPGIPYKPLVDVKGLDCWPSEPLYDQLNAEQAELLQQNSINLESNWSNWPELYQQTFGQPLPSKTLVRGKDFDKVIFGLSVASVPVVASDLMKYSPELTGAAEHIKAVATQAYQLWMVRDLKQLGWAYFDQEDGKPPVVTSFVEPVDTWAALDQLIAHEDWPDQQPKNISYFCGAMPVSDYPPFTDHTFPQQMADQVKDHAIQQINTDLPVLWPNAVSGQGFQWDWLLDPEGGQGEQRFNSQYWRANVDPSERYVQSVAGSTQYRPKTDGTGFNNLFVTGDWIKTGINAGCVEAAAQAGLLTSQAISGYPKVIRGLKDF